MVLALAAALTFAEDDAVLHPTPTDLAAMQRIGAPAVSPDGTTIVYTLGGWTFDPEATATDKRDTIHGWTGSGQLWALDLAAGSEPRQLTHADARPSSAVWSPDGTTIAFTRKLKKETRIHLLPVRGGEPRTLVTKGLSPHSLRFSPNGTAVRFLATPKRDKDTDAERFRTGDVYVFEQDARNAQLYEVPIAGGDVVPLTDGSLHVLGYDFGGRGPIVLKTSTSAIPYERIIRAGLHLVEQPGPEATPVPIPEGRCPGAMDVSDDGTLLAFAACGDVGHIRDTLLVRDLRSAKTWTPTPDTDPTLTGMVFQPDGRLLVTLSDKTRTRLWSVDPRKSKHRDLGLDEPVAWSLRSGTKNTAFLLSGAPDHATQLRRVDLKSGSSSVLVDPNPQVADWTLTTTETITWTGPEGTALEGLLSVPADADGPLTVIVLPHGGPDGVSMEGFDSWAHFFGTRGYATFRPNYRGGIAYGRDFYAANRGRLGPIEFMDIESGVDHLVQTGRADGERLVFGGWSWGGYITAWTIGHTDRYKAAVAGAAVVDTFAQYVGSDINHGDAAAWEFTTHPWTEDGFAVFDASNPRRFLHAASTPTLILHGDADPRVPFHNGVTLYRALSDLGVPTEFYVYPGAHHGLSKAAHKVHRLEVWADWYDRHLP